MLAFPLGLWLCIAAISGRADAPGERRDAPQTVQTARQAVPAKITRYAQRVLRQYDRNGDGRLQPAEYAPMAGQPARADADHDGVITLDEFAEYVAAYAEQHKLRWGPPAGPLANLASLFTPAESPETAAPRSGRASEPESPGTAARPPGPASPTASQAQAPEPPARPRRDTKFYISPKRLPPGLPDWFVGRDADGDGQLTLAEFAPRPTPAQLAEFARMDANRDGLVTARECQRALGKKGKR